MSRSMRSAALAAAAARLSYAGLKRKAPGGDATWSRTNHRGEPVTLLEGPAAAIGGAAGALVTGLDGRSRAALMLAAAGAGALGGYDDLAGSGSSRGFRGHLGALRRGELTTGAAKIAGIGATGLACSLLLGGTARREAGRKGGTAVAALDVAVNAGLIAGGANLLNLFDLRPGRAIKVTLASGALLAGSERGRAATAAPLAAAAALLPEDLGERAMLGDAGANALGAMLGTAAAVALPSRSARLALLGVIAGLTAASEVVSFTKVIERTPPLRKLDMLGRRPVPPARPADDGTPSSAQDCAGSGGAGRNGADPESTGPDGAGLDTAGLGSAGLGSAGLGSADLDGVDLDGIDLGSAGLESAGLDGAELDSADLDRARLDRAGLGSADVDSAGVDSAVGSAGAVPARPRSR